MALAQFPALTQQLTAVCTSSFRGVDAFFWALPAKHIQGTQTYTEAKHPYIHQINLKAMKIIFYIDSASGPQRYNKGFANSAEWYHLHGTNSVGLRWALE